jgi:nitroimidazol reductase NimA-like FMN-containing flavoprotein (pyridoxamine 5'-phosphate oxidase superfamily)
VCRLALNDEYPYILPLNFGLKVEEGQQIVLYFHGATEGKKYELINRNNKVGFEMDCSHKLVGDRETGMCSMEYESVIGEGYIEIIQDEDEKYEAICTIMNHYYKDGFPVNKKVIPMTTVFRLVVSKMTGKSKMM